MIDTAYVEIGENARIWHPELVNIYGNKEAICRIGNGVNIGAFVEIGPGVAIGDNVSIGAHCFIPEGVTIEDGCFIGPGVCFTNDKYPPGHKDSWGKITVKRGARIGARAVILPGITIGENALVGAGSVVTKDVLAGVVVKGNPACSSFSKRILGILAVALQRNEFGLREFLKV